MRKRIIPLTFFLAAASGCARHEHAPPTEAEFIGRWRLDPTSLPSVAKRTGRRPIESYLDLALDGSVTVVNMPIEDPFMTPEFQLLSRRGTWELEMQQTWMLTIAFDRRGYSYYIKWEGDSPIALVNYVRAPDSGESWVWRKSPDAR